MSVRANVCVCVWCPCLLAAGVEGLLKPLACLGDVALLHGGEVVGVLERDLQLPVRVLLQRAQEVLRQTTLEATQIPHHTPQPSP